MESRSECVRLNVYKGFQLPKVVVIFFFHAIAGTYVVSVSMGSDILHCIFCELSYVIGAKLGEVGVAVKTYVCRQEM